MDFTTGVTVSYNEAVTNKLHPPPDITFYLRPFTTGSWTYISIFAMTIISIVALPPWNDKAVLTSHRIVILTSWMFFLLINAYYSGALTMFFSAAPVRPFNTIREGLLKYPEWKMTIPKSDISYIDYLVKELKDPPYVDFYERSRKEGQVDRK